MGSDFAPAWYRLFPGAIVAAVTIAIAAAIAAGIAATSAGTASAAGPAYVVGDVFAAVGNGQVKQFRNTGTLLNTLTGQPSTFTTGMAFDASANLYVTGFDGAAVSKFDNTGTFLGSFGSGYDANPESIVLDAAGNFYVGQADGAKDVLKFDSTGALVDSFDVATENRGSDWTDLAADQCTLFYTSEGDLVKRYDVCTHTQLADFSTLPTGEAYALRIRPNGDVMVAATGFVYRLDSTGAVVQTYALPGTSVLFALNLDPDGSSFWTGDLLTGEIFRVDIATGNVITHFLSDPNTNMAGLAVFGEITVARVDASIGIDPQAATNPVGAGHTYTVTLLKNAGNGAGFVAASGEHVDVTLTDGNGAAHSAPTGTCTNPGANTDAAGQCTITFTSDSAGTVTVHAASTLSVSGVSLTRETDGVAPNSGDAVKTFVDANVQITPQAAVNPVGANHTLTGHLNVNPGAGGYVHAPDGTLITFAITNTGGAAAGFVGPDSCSTVGGTGSCTVVIGSSATGTTTVGAKADVTVGGVVLHRETGDGKPGDSADASKLWADVAVRTDIHSSAHGVITSAAVGDVVHDKVFVTRTAGTPAGVAADPTGNVVFHRYVGLTCEGQSVDETVVLPANESAGFTVVGDMSYQAEYLGDANYPARTGSCEPLPVTTTQPCPAGTFTSSLDASGNLNIVYDQFPAPNDNSYGANAVGWGTKGHTFGNLVGSDHAGFSLVNPAGTVVLDFNVDYISSKAGTPSGYGSLGPFGGDGKVNVGTLVPADLTFDTSQARNLNTHGFCSSPSSCTFAGTNLLTDSPKTGNTIDNYTVVDPALSAWDFHNTYFVTIKASKLAALGFDAATWKVQPNPDGLHNSPSKPCPCPTGSPSTEPRVTVSDNGNGTSTVRYEQPLGVNDNSYGVNSIGWGSKTHTFGNLVGSDKLEFRFANLDFYLDYISAKPGTPSNYGSLGVNGGDGSLLSGNAGDIVSWTTSLDRNLNSNGYFAGGVQQPGFTVPNLTVDSPPPVDSSNEASGAAAPFTAWDYTSWYQVVVKNTVFAGAPSADGVSFPNVHNSPAKANQCPATPPGGSSCNLSVAKTAVKGKEVRIEIRNNGTTDELLTALNLTWPQATNGKLRKVELGHETIYDKPDVGGGTAALTFTGHDKDRKLKKGHAETLVLEFKNHADANLAAYTATARFANCPDPLKLLGP